MTRLFPAELLTRGVDERVAYFDRLVVAHRSQIAADRKLAQVIRRTARARAAQPGVSRGAVVLFIGPTGVGKSTVQRTLSARLLAQCKEEMALDPGHIPVCALDVPGPDATTFSWPDFYARALLALDEPLADRKVLPAGLAVPGTRQHGGAPLRRAFELAVAHRRTGVIFLDEAHHMARLAPARLTARVESLKSLADMTNATYVLAGTYDLLPFRALNGQLSRRCILIHFPRYLADQAGDIKEWRKVLRTLQKHLPVPVEPRLEEDWELYYDLSVGCVGMLKDLLSRALNDALDEGSDTVDRACIEGNALPYGDLILCGRDIARGEDEVVRGEGPDPRATLRAVLARRPVGMPVPAASAVPAPRQAGRTQPGARKPRRDPVGAPAGPQAGA